VGYFRRRAAVAPGLPAEGRGGRAARRRRGSRVGHRRPVRVARGGLGRLLPVPAMTDPVEQPHRPGPIGGDMATIVFGLARPARLTSLLKRPDSTGVLAVFAFINGLLAIGVMSLTAFVTGAPFIFPSLGPTAFLLFYTPLLAAACPRNTLGGHAIGAAAGYLSLVVFGLTNAAPALATSVTGARVGAAAL